ncbi:MAG: hypothetical protein ILO36_00335 [Abditibacteriota bacterium]|nr:hypothetical protein [Abditibacteriota bacterium]
MSKNYDDIKVKKVSGSSSGKSDARAELHKLEKMFEKKILFGYTIVKVDDVIAQTQKISANLPAELEQAKSILKQSEITIAQANNEADAIINKANREKNSILQDAQMRADDMVSQDTVTERARYEAATLINEANVNIANAQTELNNYSLEVLDSLRELIENYLSSVNTTIDNIQGTIEARGAIEAEYPEEAGEGSFAGPAEEEAPEAPEAVPEDEDDEDDEE